MGKLFGTDGIRGVVNDGLDAMLAFRVGMAAAQVMTREKGGGQPRFTIGKDTRISSDLLEGALIAGLCSAGADVLHLGVIPTPAVAWITVDTKPPTTPLSTTESKFSTARASSSPTSWRGRLRKFC